MKTNMNNKMLKVFLLVAIFATTQMPAVFAQEASAAETQVEFVYSSGAPMELGDTVMIHQDSLRYLTGERMSSWVYGVPHTIRQLGTKSKPTGVLLRGIYSWIAQGSLVPLNKEKTQEAIAAKRAAEEAAIAAVAAAQAAEAQAAAEAAAAAAAAEAAAQAAAEAAAAEAAAKAEAAKKAKPVPYQVDRFTIGVRGGLASLLPKAEPAIGSAWGFDALLDLQYAHYWAKDAGKIELGILTGASIGYMQYGKVLHDVKETATLGAGNDVTDYVVTIDEASTVNRQLQLEVPVMFSMVTPKGFFLNAGPKLILPVYTPYNQSLKNTTITATDIETGVVLVDNPVMGSLNKEFAQKGMNDHKLALTLALGAELGYEHKLQSGHSVSVGVYANYGVYNTYKQANETAKQVVSIVPPTAASAAQVTVNSVNNAYVNKLGYFDAGLKLAFNLNWKK